MMSTQPLYTLAIGMDQILNKYWELANLDVERTKGSITGQLRALDVLCEHLALEAGQKKPKQLNAPDIYRAKWMPEPGREN